VVATVILLAQDLDRPDAGFITNDRYSQQARSTPDQIGNAWIEAMRPPGLPAEVLEPRQNLGRI
jgi:hypothetical protein